MSSAESISTARRSVPSIALHDASHAWIPATIEVARLALIIGLVFLHYGTFPNSDASPFHGLDPDRYPLATFINSFVLFFFFSAVPLLSMISGWLFFRMGSEQPIAAIMRRVRGRFMSLYAPLIAWNGLYLAGILALTALGTGNSVLGQLNLHLDTARPLDVLNAVFGLTSRPIAFQFWFVRDLFVTALISPALWLVLNRAPAAGAVGLGVVWITNSTLGIFLRPDVVFFFYLGAMAQIQGWNLWISSRTTLFLMIVYITLTALHALAPLVVDQTMEGRQEWLDAATCAGRLIGVGAAWGTCIYLTKNRWGQFLARTSSLAFFLFASHFPMIALVKIILWHALAGETDTRMIIHYMGSVFITIVSCAILAQILGRLFPNIFFFLSGGRKLEKIILLKKDGIAGHATAR